MSIRGLATGGDGRWMSTRSLLAHRRQRTVPKGGETALRPLPLSSRTRCECACVRPIEFAPFEVVNESVATERSGRAPTFSPRRRQGRDPSDAEANKGDAADGEPRSLCVTGRRSRPPRQQLDQTNGPSRREALGHTPIARAGSCRGRNTTACLVLKRLGSNSFSHSMHAPLLKRARGREGSRRWGDSQASQS